MAGQFVSYIRVSTGQPARTGLVLDQEEQREAVHKHLAGGKLVGEYIEAEAGKDSARPKLANALPKHRRHPDRVHARPPIP
jgi:hypothetical protein